VDDAEFVPGGETGVSWPVKKRYFLAYFTVGTEYPWESHQWGFNLRCATKRLQKSVQLRVANDVPCGSRFPRPDGNIADALVWANGIIMLKNKLQDRHVYPFDANDCRTGTIIHLRTNELPH
jgi:hypothetical protein